VNLQYCFESPGVAPEVGTRKADVKARHPTFALGFFGDKGPSASRRSRAVGRRAGSLLACRGKGLAGSGGGRTALGDGRAQVMVIDAMSYPFPAPAALSDPYASAPVSFIA
jgi:hypothetical protein